MVLKHMWIMWGPVRSVQVGKYVTQIKYLRKTFPLNKTVIKIYLEYNECVIYVNEMILMVNSIEFLCAVIAHN